MEYLSREILNKEITYVLYENIEYERTHDFESNKITWIKDIEEELGKPEVVKDYMELEQRYRKMLENLGYE